MAHCDICGFPATDDEDGFDRLRDHLSDTHGIESYQAAMEHIAEDDPAPANPVI